MANGEVEPDTVSDAQAALGVRAGPVANVEVALVLGVDRFGRLGGVERRLGGHFYVTGIHPVGVLLHAAPRPA